jgi:hypothetical protein
MNRSIRRKSIAAVDSGSWSTLKPWCFEGFLISISLMDAYATRMPVLPPFSKLRPIIPRNPLFRQRPCWIRSVVRFVPH